MATRTQETDVGSLDEMHSSGIKTGLIASDVLDRKGYSEEIQAYALLSGAYVRDPSDQEFQDFLEEEYGLDTFYSAISVEKALEDADRFLSGEDAEYDMPENRKIYQYLSDEALEREAEAQVEQLTG